MNVVSIASILPIPGFTKQNDYVFALCQNLLKYYPNNTFSFIKPIMALPAFLSEITKKWGHILHTNKLSSCDHHGFFIKIVPYIAIRRWNITFALFSLSIVLLNKKYFNELGKNQVDLIHAHYVFPDGLLAYYLFKKHNIPYIITIQSEQRFFTNMVSRFVAKTIVRNAKGITTFSHLMKNQLVKEGFINVKLVPIGLDESFFVHRGNHKAVEPVRILTVGHLNSLKNIEKVITTFAELQNRYNIRLSIIGEGPKEALFNKLINKFKIADKVTLKRSLDHQRLILEYSTHDIFILPSYKETFGRVYFEALAAGLPIICTRNTGAYGFLTEGESCLAVDPDDVSDIKAKLEILITNLQLRRTLGQGGRETVEAARWENIVKVFYQIYENAVRHSSHCLNPSPG
jgi:glycosyltransferase involved in cell wall biosynthesis